MKILKRYGLGVVLFCLCSITLAQTLDLEKTYKISRASKRGNLAGLDFDANAKTYTLTYFTDMKNKSDKYIMKYEQYVFDNDFNFIKDGEFEEETDKMKSKFKWFRFKGDKYVSMGNTVEMNMMQRLVIKQKQITSTYSYFLGGYTRKVELLEKVKPRTEDGNAYTPLVYFEDDVNGDLFICGVVVPRSGKNMEEAGKTRLIKYNKDLDLVKTTDFDFDFLQTLVYAKGLTVPDFDDPENESVNSMVFVFAPSNAGSKKQTDPNNNNYTYVKVDNKGEVIEKFSFQSPSSYWAIEEAIFVDNGDVYLYGPAAAGKDKYFNAGVKPGISIGGGGEVKYKAIQLMKVANGKMEYLTEATLDEIKSKQKFPASQRKTPDYEGREFGVNDYEILANGDFLVLGQNYEKTKEGGIQQFKDLIGLQFDKGGKFKFQYGIDTKEDGIAISQRSSGMTTIRTTQIFSNPQNLFESSDGNLYWLLQEIKGFGLFGGDKLLTYPRMGKVDTNSGNVSDFKSFGKGDGYYLDPKYPYLQTDKNETIVFFGADKAGKELWFARVKLK